MSWFEYESRIFSWFYSTTYCLCGQLCLLVLRCAGDRCDMQDSDEYHGRSRRPGAKDWEWSSIGQVLGGWMIE
jgi:hypothetical protein